MEWPPSSAGGDNATGDQQLRHAAGIQGDSSMRGVNDDEVPNWDWDPIGGILQEETGQEAANTSEECSGANRIPFVTSLLGTGAHFDEESTDTMNPVSAGFDPRMPELDHMMHKDQSQDDRLTPETLVSNDFPPGQDDPRQYASTAPTSLPNTGPQSSLLSDMTSASTVSSLDGSGVCPKCGFEVSTMKEDEDRNKNVRRHMREKHGPSVPCPHCDRNFTRPSNRKRHIANTHG